MASMHTKNLLQTVMKGYTNNPLGFIPAFIMLVYAAIMLILVFTQSDKLRQTDITALVYFLVLFPVILFIGFLWAVKYHFKLYAPKDYNDDDSFFISVLMTAAAIQRKNNGKQLSLNKLKGIAYGLRDNASKSIRQRNTKRKEILWVDDNPDNNLYERYLFEASGIAVTSAQSTNEAMNLLNSHRYSAIISDMQRAEGGEAGIELLQKIRNMNNNTPFFIYTGNKTPQKEEKTKENGGQGCTDSPEELYRMVLSL